MAATFTFAPINYNLFAIRYPFRSPFDNGIDTMSIDRTINLVANKCYLFPFTIMVEEAEITSPPCVVLSPSNTNPLDIYPPVNIIFNVNFLHNENHYQDLHNQVRFSSCNVIQTKHGAQITSNHFLSPLSGPCGFFSGEFL